MNTRMARDAFDHDINCNGTCRTMNDATGVASVPVEAQGRAAELVDARVTSTDETDFFLHRKEKRQRRMRQLLLENHQCRAQHDGDSRAIVSAESCRAALRHDAVPVADRLAADTQRDRVHVGHEQASWPSDRPRQLHDQVAALAADRALAVRHVVADRGRRHACLSQRTCDELRDGAFLTAAPWNRHQFGGELQSERSFRRDLHVRFHNEES
jgi:hypothetical protein